MVSMKSEERFLVIFIKVDEDILGNKDMSSRSTNSLLNFSNEWNVPSSGTQKKLQECASELSSLFEELKIDEPHPQLVNMNMRCALSLLKVGIM